MQRRQREPRGDLPHQSVPSGGNSTTSSGAISTVTEPPASAVAAGLSSVLVSGTSPTRSLRSASSPR